MIALLLSNWRAIGLVVLIVTGLSIIAASRVQLSKCRLEVASIQRAHDLLLARVEEQNAEIKRMEDAGAAAAEKGRRERAKAATVVRVVEDKAAGLEAALRAPKMPSEAVCQEQDAVRVVRADLAQ